MSPGPQITFVQDHTAPLRTGRFKVTVTQAISVAGSQQETFQAVQELAVTGPRYALAPSAVSSVFPPDGNQGEFSNVFAHAVLTQPALPWTRSVEPPGSGPAPGSSPTTWLAILVFDHDDPPPAPRTMTLADLASKDGVLFPAREPELGEQQTDPVVVIDVPLELFKKLAPSAEDLQWLAHVRQVEDDAADTSSDYAVVFANRLPASGSLNTAHLVSLEGYAPYLPANDGTPSTAFPSATSSVRLVSLEHWTFTAVDLKQTFQGTLSALDMSPPVLQLPLERASSASPAADAAVHGAFEMGYTALDHRLRNGDATVSWYRGPLLPLGTTADTSPPYANQDQQLRFDPATGMLDTSRAAAWQLGRLLALHDMAFASALYRWKLTHTQQAVNQLEQEIIEAELPDAVATDADAHPRARVAAVAKALVAPAATRLTRRRHGKAA
jgi:hypothetical protein